MTEAPYPTTACRGCGAGLNDATSVEGGPTPTAGAISICFYCGATSVFTEDLYLREPTPEEQEDFDADPGYQRAVANRLLAKERYDLIYDRGV